MALEQGPGDLPAVPMPTTAERRVEESALRAAMKRIEKLRRAVVDAKAIFDEIEPLLDDREAAAEVVERWQEKYAGLAEPPLDIEVEPDDDSTEEPEGALWEREMGR